MGTSDSENGRKNAFEVKQNGDIYIAGLAGVLQDYIGGVIPLPPVKIQTFGDSITDNHWGDNSSWVSFISDNISSESLTVINSAVAGAKIASGDNSLYNQVTKGCNRSGGTFAPPLDSDADIVVIFCGTNDYSSSESIAGVENQLDNCFSEIIRIAPTAKVLVCTPLQRYNAYDQSLSCTSFGVPYNSSNLTLRDYCDEIIKASKRYSFPVLDLHAEANINRGNLSVYTTDGLHPNSTGDEYLAKIICKRIKELAETL